MAGQLEQKTAEIKIRVSPRVKARLLHLANDYADGNLSAWMEYAGLTARRKRLNPAHVKTKVLRDQVSKA